MRSNKGVTLMDIVLAITILSLFVGVIGTFYYQIAFNNELIKLNANAAYYAVKIAEDIDKYEYSEVNNELKQTLISEYQLPETYDIDITIENYNELEGNTTKRDILKIATIEVKYKCFDQEKTYRLSKLKVKER